MNPRSAIRQQQQQPKDGGKKKKLLWNATVYQSTQLHISEDSKLQQNCENLEPCNNFFFLKELNYVSNVTKYMLWYV